VKIDNGKISLFFSLFRGITTVYGTYSPNTGRYWQIKKPVTKHTIYSHLMGIQPYGFYPLFEDLTRTAVVDFDDHNPEPPILFIKRANHFGIKAYLERSKSKGYHAWVFFEKEGVQAKKIRTIIKSILEEIECPNTEIFPKQDKIVETNSYGNFINAPLFGKHAAKGRTIFLEPDENLKPYGDQWELLKSIKRNNHQLLNEIIETNSIEENQFDYIKNKIDNQKISGYALPICIRKILEKGVTHNQRIACFRIAVHLKRVGLPHDSIISILNNWRQKNRPTANKIIITENEIKEQTAYALKKDYTGYGCKETIIAEYCDQQCPVRKGIKTQQLKNEHISK
jgi:hypothetical protein